MQSLSRVITDGGHQAPPQIASGIPFLVISNIANGVICFDDTRFVPRTYFDEIKPQRVPQRGDLLLSVTGSYGIPAVVNTDRDFCFQRHIALIKPFLSANFLSRVVSSSYCSKWFDKKATGTAQKTVALSILRSTLIPVPPLAEQRRIVGALGKYLALVDGIERNWVDLDGLLAQLKPKVLDLAIRGRLTERDPADEPASELLKRIHAEKLAMVGRGELKPKDVKVDTVIFTGSDGLRYEKPADGKGEPRCIEDEIPFELPEGWAWARFSNIVRKIGSKDNQVKTKGLLKNGDYPVISQSASSYVDGYYSGTIQPITSVPVLLFGDHTRTVKYINQPFVIGADGTKCHNAIGINPVFLFHAMQVAAERIENRGYGRHYALLERYLLAIPPLAEQRRINSAIEAIISATNL